MKLIVGLGNPDKEYLNTFHNLGFMSVDKLAKLFQAEFNKEKCRAMIAETRVNGQKILIAKRKRFPNRFSPSRHLLIYPPLGWE